jgi:hypothetical protein
MRPTSRSPAGGDTSYRAIDQYGQIIDVYVSNRRDTRTARRFFSAALRAHGEPAEVVTDRAPALPAAIDELLSAAFHDTAQYANNRVECDHGRLKARLRPMRGLKRDHTTPGHHARPRAHAEPAARALRKALLHWRIVAVAGECGGRVGISCWPGPRSIAFGVWRVPLPTCGCRKLVRHW